MFSNSMETLVGCLAAFTCVVTRRIAMPRAVRYTCATTTFSPRPDIPECAIFCVYCSIQNFKSQNSAQERPLYFSSNSSINKDLDTDLSLQFLSRSKDKIIRTFLK